MIIDGSGVRADPEKLKTIQDFSPPQNRKQLQGFLGVCGFSRRFVVKHADFVSPFRELLKPNTKWDWTQDHDNAFSQIKLNFLHTVTLSHVIPNCKFRLQTDASDAGICGVLYQEKSEEDLRVVAITSRVLTKCELKYTVTEKELLAIVYSLLKFRRYLLGMKFDIVTDHKALTFMLNTPYHNARMTRWVLFIQEYDYDIRHCKGTDNVVADYFSRNFKGTLGANQNQNSYLICQLGKGCVDAMTHGKGRGNVISNVEMRRELLDELRELSRLQANDEMTKCLYGKNSKFLEFRRESGIMYCKSIRDENWKLIIPKGLIKQLCLSIHEQLGHAGGGKMHRYMSRFFYWRYMRRDIRDFSRKCDLCQRTKCLNYRMEGKYQMVKSNFPNDIASVNFYGPLPTSTAGVKYIFVVQDLFSKYVSLYPMKAAKTQSCLKIFNKKYFIEVGKPKRILSDNGTQFTSRA